MLTAARRRPLLSGLLTIFAALVVFAGTYSATGHSLQHLVGYPCR